MKRSHGGYSKRSRSLTAAKAPANRLLADFKAGTRVRLTFNPLFLKGRPNALRFNNKIGVVLKKQGGSFEMEFFDGNKKKKAPTEDLIRRGLEGLFKR